jgi:hypothetical protein
VVGCVESTSFSGSNSRAEHPVARKAKPAARITIFLMLSRKNGASPAQCMFVASLYNILYMSLKVLAIETPKYGLLKRSLLSSVLP